MSIREDAEELKARSKSIAERVRELFNARAPESPAPPLSTPQEPVTLNSEDMIVRTARYTIYTDGGEGARYNPTAKTFILRDGYETSYRPRTSEDGEAAYIVIDDGPPKETFGEEPAGETYAQWRSRVINEGASGRTQAGARKAGFGTSEPAPSPSTFVSRLHTAFTFGVEQRNPPHD